MIVDNGSAHRGQRSIDRLEGTWGNLVLVHTPIHASVNQAEIYFSIVQRKVVTPNDFDDLDTLEQHLLAFGRRYEQIAAPFQWKFARRAQQAAHRSRRATSRLPGRLKPWDHRYVGKLPSQSTKQKKRGEKATVIHELDVSSRPAETLMAGGARTGSAWGNCCGRSGRCGVRRTHSRTTRATAVPGTSSPRRCSPCRTGSAPTRRRFGSRIAHAHTRWRHHQRNRVPASRECDRHSCPANSVRRRSLPECGMAARVQPETTAKTETRKTDLRINTRT